MEYVNYRTQHWVCLMVLMGTFREPWALLMHRNAGALPDPDGSLGTPAGGLGGIPGTIEPGETPRMAAHRVMEQITSHLDYHWVQENGGTRMNWVPVCTTQARGGVHVHWQMAWPSNQQRKVFNQLDGHYRDPGKLLTHRVGDVLAAPAAHDLDPRMRWVLPLALDETVTAANIRHTRHSGMKHLMAVPRWRKGEAVLMDVWDGKVIANVHPEQHQQAPDADGICELTVLPDGTASVKFAVRVPGVLLDEFVAADSPDGYQVQVQKEGQPETPEADED